MNKELGINPWLSIWVKPRQTIRKLASYNTNYRLVTLCAIYGFQYMLQAAQFLSLGRASSLLMILILALVLCIPVGYIVFNVTSAFLFWVGKLIKGKGTYKQIRAATYWSAVPSTVSILVWAFLMVTYGNSLFITGYEKEVVGGAAIINIVAGVSQIVLGIWAIVIFLHALGEMQGFSAWMALLNAFLASLSVFIVVFMLTWGISAITQLAR